MQTVVINGVLVLLKVVDSWLDRRRRKNPDSTLVSNALDGVRSAEQDLKELKRKKA